MNETIIESVIEKLRALRMKTAAEHCWRRRENALNLAV
jgi:hypothetical protein